MEKKSFSVAFSTKRVDRQSRALRRLIFLHPAVALHNYSVLSWIIILYVIKAIAIFLRLWVSVWRARIIQRMKHLVVNMGICIIPGLLIKNVRIPLIFISNVISISHCGTDKIRESGEIAVRRTWGAFRKPIPVFQTDGNRALELLPNKKEMSVRQNTTRHLNSENGMQIVKVSVSNKRFHHCKRM